MADELLKDLAKSDAEYDEMEDQYLCQIFADDEEINRVEAEAVEKSIEAIDRCKTKEEFEALTREA